MLGTGVVIGFQQVHLLQDQFQPERVAVGEGTVGLVSVQSFSEKKVEGAGVRLAVEALVIPMGDLAGLLPRHGRQRFHLDAGFFRQCFGFGPGNGGGDEAGVFRPELGQPGEIFGAGGALELVERVDEDNDAGALRSPAEEGGERLLDLLRTKASSPLKKSYSAAIFL